MISEAAKKKINVEIKKYPADQRQSAVMAALAIVQDEQGYLTPLAMDEVAQYLDMPSVAVLEVATFYAMYNLKPTGRHKITLCTNLPCALSGANEAADILQKSLGVAMGETTVDGRITLKEGECFGACGDAPVLLVNNKRVCPRMTRKAIEELLKELT